MPLNIIRNDISKVSADAIVNSANPEVAIGDGVDSTIYEAAGAEKLFAEREKIGPMKPGQAAATPAFDLDAKYIIHTAGPVWRDGKHGEYEAVANCYREPLRIADELGCESIAFPLISTGNYGFPKDKALNIAISEISNFLFTHDMDVYLVVYDKESFVISGKAFADIKSYVEEADVTKRLEQLRRRETTGLPSGRYAANYPVAKGTTTRRRRDLKRPELEEEAVLREEALDLLPELEEEVLETEESFAMFSDALQEDEIPDTVSYSTDFFEDFRGEAEEGIKRVIKGRGETFQEMLFRIIDRKGLKDPEVYKKANIDRKLFSKIRSDSDYKPSKRTVLALAVALELNMDETLDLLARAGYTLSPANKSDLIVGYCITHKIYNIHRINMYLFDFEEPVLAG